MSREGKTTETSDQTKAMKIKTFFAKLCSLILETNKLDVRRAHLNLFFLMHGVWTILGPAVRPHSHKDHISRFSIVTL